MSEKIQRLLARLGLTQHLQTFVDNDIDDDILVELDDADLKELGISLGHRKKILKALSEDIVAPGAEAPPASEAERRQLTVMFCDLVASTALSTALDVEEYRELIGNYQNVARRAVGQFDGFIARYMGDGLLVYFGYPQAHEDDVERAVRASLSVVAAVSALATLAGEKLAVRIGIATGPVVAGDIVGEGASEELAVLGETPNLAARLQALAKANTVVVSRETRWLAGRLFRFERLGDFSLKGFETPVEAWQVVSEAVSESRFAATRITDGVPLVGRDSEIGLLLDRWERVLDAEGQVIVVSGEPGIGKSRLIHTLRQRVEASAHAVLQFQCSPYYASSAYYPFIDQIQRAAKFASDDDAEAKRRKLESWATNEARLNDDALGLLANLLSLSTRASEDAAPGSTQAHKERTTELLVENIIGQARQQPLLILFEDVHWADPTTLDILRRLIDSAPEAAIALVVTHRPGFVPPWPASGQTTALSLSRLGKRQVTSLVTSVTEGRRLPEALMAEIVSKTDGIPLFVEELTKTVIEAGFLVAHDDRYALSGPLPSLAVPSTLRDSLVARLDRLGRVKEIAQIAAVIGREFSAELLAFASGLEKDVLDAALMQLCDSELISQREHGADALYVFKHALVQEAAYDSLLRRRQVQLHADIAAALEEHFPETASTEPELLAHHCVRAGQIADALEYWRAAAQLAVEQSAYQESLSHLDAARQSLEGLADRDMLRRAELELEIARGGVLMVSEGYLAKETERAFARAAEIAEVLGDQSRLFAALRGLHGVHIVRAEIATALQVAESCLDIAEAQREERAIALATRLVGQTQCLAGQLVAAREQLERSMTLSVAEESEDITALVHGGGYRTMTYAFLAHVLWLQGFPDQAVELARRGLGNARSQHGVFFITASMYFLAWLHGWCRDYESLQATTAEMGALAHEHKITAWESTAEILGDWPVLSVVGSAQANDSAEARLGDVRSSVGLRTPYKLGLLAIALRDGGRAIELVDEAIALTATTGERWCEPELHRMKGDLLMRHDADTRLAQASLETAHELAIEQQAKAWQLRSAMSLARLWVDDERKTEGRDLLRGVYDTFSEGFDTPDLIDARDLLSMLD